ncbi:MAG: LysM peptidoglycan-binding domain-containing protein [Planctomycetota bacterium]
MTAPYKIALAAGGLLLLVVVASVLRGGAPESANPDSDGETLALNDGQSSQIGDPPAIDPLPPTDTRDLGLDLDLDPMGPPVRDGMAAASPSTPATRVDYLDESPIELPVIPEPHASMTVGRDAFTDEDPLARGGFDPLTDPVSPPEPEPIPLDDDTLAEVTATEISPAEANTGIALGPLDPVTPAGADPTESAAIDLPPPAPPILRLYTIESGDSLSSIALATYGSANKWVDIAQANPLVDPNRLRVGQEIKLPNLDGVPANGGETGATAEANDDLPRRGAVYTVKSGDNLSNIAKQFYNSSAKWELIYQANRQKIGDDPGALQLGMELLIPPPDTGAN